jgi:hypothetical protein
MVITAKYLPGPGTVTDLVSLLAIPVAEKAIVFDQVPEVFWATTVSSDESGAVEGLQLLSAKTNDRPELAAAAVHGGGAAAWLGITAAANRTTAEMNDLRASGETFGCMVA